MYGEEADLCHRARQIGARPMITPTATIIHYGGASEAEKTDKRIKLLAGKITLMRRHWSALPTLRGGCSTQWLRSFDWLCMAL